MSAYRTSLNENPVAFRDARNAYYRGINWMVFKIGRKWELAPCFGKFPLFETKSAAYEAGVQLLFAAIRYEADQQAAA